MPTRRVANSFANVSFAVVGTDGSPIAIGTGSDDDARSTGAAVVDTGDAKVAGGGVTFTLSLH